MRTKSIQIVQRMTGRHLRSHFADQAVTQAAIETDDGSVSCCYVLEVAERGPTRIAYCTNATRHEWVVATVDAKRIRTSVELTEKNTARRLHPRHVPTRRNLYAA